MFITNPPWHLLTSQPAVLRRIPQSFVDIQTILYAKEWLSQIPSPPTSGSAENSPWLCQHPNHISDWVIFLMGWTISTMPWGAWNIILCWTNDVKILGLPFIRLLVNNGVGIYWTGGKETHYMEDNVLNRQFFLLSIVAFWCYHISN
jgi:hypothetical protein